MHKEFIAIVLGLIDSREHNNNMAHYDSYFERLANIQKIIDDRKTWTIDSKKEKLNLKPITK